MKKVLIVFFVLVLLSTLADFISGDNISNPPSSNNEGFNTIVTPKFSEPEIKEMLVGTKGKTAFEVMEAIKEKETGFTIICLNYGQVLSNFDPNAFYLEYDAAVFYEDKEIRLVLLPGDMSGYKDYEERLSQIGEIIEFGSYEQYGDESNGKEAIKWIVLDTKGSKRLLCSLYILDNKRYNDPVSATPTTWEDSSLRYWLNNTFINDAFTQKQKSAIMVTTVENDQRTTQDEIFLLSYGEAWQYFSDASLRQAAPTPYARENKIFVIKGTGMSAWWLRTSVDTLYKFEVDPSGLHENSPRINEDSGIRPALWIDLDLLSKT